MVVTINVLLHDSYNDMHPIILLYYAAQCHPRCISGYTCVAPNTCRRGVQLMLGGVNYPNNSVIQFDNIYPASDHCHSLICTTDLVPCCSSRTGNWYHSQLNGSSSNTLPNTNIYNYYQGWGSDGTVRLIRRSSFTPTTDSIHCCQLYDATKTLHTLCVTIGILTVL